jgi:hypothetical protein
MFQKYSYENINKLGDIRKFLRILTLHEIISKTWELAEEDIAYKIDFIFRYNFCPKRFCYCEHSPTWDWDVCRVGLFLSDVNHN